MRIIIRYTSFTRNVTWFSSILHNEIMDRRYFLKNKVDLSMDAEEPSAQYFVLSS